MALYESFSAIDGAHPEKCDGIWSDFFVQGFMYWKKKKSVSKSYFDAMQMFSADRMRQFHKMWHSEATSAGK